MQATSLSSRQFQEYRLFALSILLRLIDSQFRELRLRELPNGIGKVRLRLPAKGLRQMNISNQIHRFIGMKRHFSQTKLNIQSKLTADRTDDAAQRDRLTTADIKDVATGQRSVFEDQANCFG